MCHGTSVQKASVGSNCLFYGRIVTAELLNEVLCVNNFRVYLFLHMKSIFPIHLQLLTIVKSSDLIQGKIAVGTNGSPKCDCRARTYSC